MQNAKCKMEDKIRNNRYAIFLDRDGTIIDDVGYIRRAEDVRLLPLAAEGLRVLQAAGYALIVVSNQSGLARGIFTEEEHRCVMERFIEILKNENIVLTDYLFCPHHPEGVVEKYRKACNCRKGKPGMLLEGAKRHHINLAGSWMIGDKAADVEAGVAGGVRTIRIGQPAAGEKNSPAADFYADNLTMAAKIILNDESKRCLS
jgi:D-glycero-D-manno-heptose 1,7-bisphosphate phosphatase